MIFIGSILKWFQYFVFIWLWLELYYLFCWPCKSEQSENQKGASINRTIPVSNTGNRDGVEGVQVHVHQMNDKGGSHKTLRDFQRVNVAAGKNNQATIHLQDSAFEFFDRASGKWLSLQEPMNCGMETAPMQKI